MPKWTSFLFSLLLTGVSAQTYRDDSLAVVEILAANNLDTVAVTDVSSTMNGRIYSLSLYNRGLRVLPECIGKLDSLVTVSVSGNNLFSLPQSLGTLSKLETLYCYDNNIYELPSTFSQLRNLKVLYLIRNRFTRWPEVFYTMPNLETIDLGGNHLTEIPGGISACTTVKKLYINDNYITQLPESIAQLDLQLVHVAGNALCNASTAIQNWLGLKDYYKENAKWRTYQTCGDYAFDTVKVRDLLSVNGWNNLPIDSVIVKENGDIVGIDVSYEKRNAPGSPSKVSNTSGRAMVFSPGIESLKHLRMLNLSGNNIDTIPGWFDKLCHLEKLDLSKNRLAVLPDFMAAFRNLGALNLAGNRISKVSEKAGQWADTYAPGWRNAQSGTGTAFNQGDRIRTDPGIAVIAFSNRMPAIQVRFDKPIIAEIALFSVSGRCIESLAKKRFEPGVYDFNLDNKRLPHGPFLVTVKSEKHGLNAGRLSTVRVRKLIVL